MSEPDTQLEELKAAHPETKLQELLEIRIENLRDQGQLNLGRDEQFSYLPLDLYVGRDQFRVSVRFKNINAKGEEGVFEPQIMFIISPEA